MILSTISALESREASSPCPFLLPHHFDYLLTYIHSKVAYVDMRWHSVTLHAYTSRAVVLSKRKHHCDDQDLLSLLCAFLSVAPRYRKFGKDGKSLLCQSKSKLHTYIFTFSYTHASALPFLYKINVHFQPDNRQPLCVISTQHVLKLHSLHLHILCLLCSTPYTMLTM